MRVSKLASRDVRDLQHVKIYLYLILSTDKEMVEGRLFFSKASFYL